MSIRIIDDEVCLTCKKETCAYIDVTTKNGTFFSSEGSVCPNGVLQSNPALMPASPFTKKECVSCGLCVGYCGKNNLQADGESDTFTLDCCNSLALNAMASSYLNKIFPFASNSNRNSSIHFDGYVEIGTDDEAFVEVDEKDALECYRSLLEDFLMYKGQFADEVDKGLIVLKEIPRKGSNIYGVIEKMREFPHLEAKKIYFTTFSLLRHLFLHKASEKAKFEELFFYPAGETLEAYAERISVLTGLASKGLCINTRQS